MGHFRRGSASRQKVRRTSDRNDRNDAKMGSGRLPQKIFLELHPGASEANFSGGVGEENLYWHLCSLNLW